MYIILQITVLQEPRYDTLLQDAILRVINHDNLIFAEFIDIILRQHP